MYYKFLLWLMGLAGGISSWAWREHVKILKRIQDIEHKKLIDGSDLINEMDFNNQQKGEGRWK